MRVVAYSPNLTSERAAAMNVQALSKQALFAESNVVSVHLLLSDRTRGIVGSADLARMKRTAFLVNTARGLLVDEHALADALRRGVLQGAGVDVYSHEPIRSDNPLLTAPGTVLTPHIGYVTRDIYTAWYAAAVDSIHAYRQGHPIRVLT